MRDSARYAKIVEWSEEDQCYVGSAPGLIYAGCHGEDEKAVFEELCQVVEEAIELYREDGKALPPTTSGGVVEFRHREPVRITPPYVNFQSVGEHLPLGGPSGHRLFQDRRA